MQINFITWIRLSSALSVVCLMNVFANGQPCSASFVYSVSNCDITLTNQSTGPGTLLWNWNFGDGNTSTQQNPVHTFSVSGTYTVCLSMQNTAGTCSGNYCLPIIVNCVTGVNNEPSAELSLSSYPNPAVWSSAIVYSLTSNANIHLVFYDLLGNEAAILDNGNKTAGTHTVSFDTNFLSHGIYLLHFNCNGKTFTKKFILTQ